MAQSTFLASALKRQALKAPAKIESTVNASGPVFGSRLLEVDFIKSEGWQAPTLRDYGDLTLRPQISALHYGLQVFDHMLVTRDHKTQRPRVFRHDMVLDRLAKSRDYLHFAPYDNKELFGCLKALVLDDEPSIPTAAGETYIVRTCIIGNNNNLSAGPADEFKLYAFGTCVNSKNSAPMKLKADAHARRSWRGGTGQYAMGGNYANQIFIEQESRQNGFDRNLWLVDGGFITTAGEANFFAVVKRSDGKQELITPPLDGTTMPGVMRDCVLQVAKQGGDLVVTESDFTIQDLSNAARSGTLVEAFATSTPSVTKPIGSVFYNDNMINVPVPEKGLAAKLKADISRIQRGEVENSWSTLL